jgi:hypothetical protein
LGTTVSADKNKVKVTNAMEQGTVARQPSVPAPPPPAQGLELDVQAHLGRQLRAVYDDLAGQPVPDRFIELLNALEQKQAAPRTRAAAAPEAGQAFDSVAAAGAGDA